MGDWSAQIHDMQSGQFLVEAQLTPASRWGHGDLSFRTAEIILHDGLSKSEWRDVIRGVEYWDRAIVFLYDGKPVTDSIIVGAPTYNRRTHSVTIKHVGVEKLLERRWMFGVGTSQGEGGYSPTGEFSVSGVSVAGAAVRILQQAYREPISPSWPIRVQLPAVEAGSFSKTWKHHQFQNAAAMIRSLTSRADGPQMDLRPVLVNGELDRVQRVGTLAGPRLDVHIDADDTIAESVGYGEEGEETGTGMHFIGKGSDAGMRVGAAFLPPSAGLARDLISQDKTEENVARLVELARGKLEPREHAIVRRLVTAKASKINPADLRRGGTIGLYSEDRYWEPDFQLVRVVGFSGNCSGKYDIETQGA